MGEGFFSRGFFGRPRRQDDDRLPPGQYLEDGFPVLSSAPTFPSVRCAVHTAQPFADALLVGYLPSSLHFPRAVHYASF